MNREEQIRILLHSEQYSEEQLDKMLEDTNIPTPDVDKEWQRFKARKQSKPRRLSKPMQWAATLAVMAVLSGISYAAIYHFALKEDEEAVTATTPTVSGEKSAVQAAPAEERKDTVRAARNFNNVQLQDIMKQLNRDYGVKVVFNNESARTIRLYLSWEADDHLQDIVNRINHFEKVNLTLSEGTITIE